MVKEHPKDIINKIIEAIKSAIAEVYDDARKTGRELVISDKTGKIKKIKVQDEK